MIGHMYIASYCIVIFQISVTNQQGITHRYFLCVLLKPGKIQNDVSISLSGPMKVAYKSCLPPAEDQFTEGTFLFFHLVLAM